MSDQRIGIICGLKAEARLLDDARTEHPIDIGISGASPARAEALAGEFAAAGVCGLISFGVAGGLAGHLKPGDLIIASSIRDTDHQWPTDTKWSEHLVQYAKDAGFAVETGGIFGSNDMVLTTDHKHRLAAETGCVAVDMESQGVARIASQNRIPVVALRAVGDPASRAIPQSATVGVSPDGDMRSLAVLREVLKRPGDLPGLIQVGRDSGKALQTLRRCLRQVLPALLRIV